MQQQENSLKFSSTRKSSSFPLTHRNKPNNFSVLLGLWELLLDFKSWGSEETSWEFFWWSKTIIGRSSQRLPIGDYLTEAFFALKDSHFCMWKLNVMCFCCYSSEVSVFAGLCNGVESCALRKLGFKTWSVVPSLSDFLTIFGHEFSGSKHGPGPDSVRLRFAFK